MAFGCVKLQTCAQRRYTIRNCSADLLILDCSIATLDNTPSSVFSLQTASHLALQPGEATTLILAYAPHAVQEDVALLKLQPADPAQTRHAVCLLGFGGQCHAEVALKDKVMISNTATARPVSSSWMTPRRTSRSCAGPPCCRHISCCRP